MEFIAFDKMARINRQITITEKIDGTNAQVAISPGGVLFAGSRTRWVRPGDDNFGFAQWVEDNAAELRKLGEGRHYGEWWGGKIQRGYGVPDKRFSLFNTGRWGNSPDRPACAGVVPHMYTGEFSQAAIDDCLARLREEGSVASPGYMRPEGIVIWHHALRKFMKVTLDNDGVPKSQCK